MGSFSATDSVQSHSKEMKRGEYADIRARFTKQLQLPSGYFFDVCGKGKDKNARPVRWQ